MTLYWTSAKTISQSETALSAKWTTFLRPKKPPHVSLFLKFFCLALTAKDTVMSTPDFQLNPIGIDYDVEDIMRRMEAGEDESSIIKRPGGPRPNDPPRIPGL